MARKRAKVCFRRAHPGKTFYADRERGAISYQYLEACRLEPAPNQGPASVEWNDDFFLQYQFTTA